MMVRHLDESERLLSRLHERGGMHADEVGHVAQTRHLELAARDHDGAAALWEVARSAARVASPRLEQLRFVTITTDSPGSFAAWVQSLRATLDEAGWRPGTGPEIEVLRVANDADPSIDAAHRLVGERGIKIHVVDTDASRRPLPLAEARPFAFRALRDLGWVPSPRAPVWSLDEDFRFDTLVPSPRAMFVRRSGGPLFHRLDVLVSRLAEEGVDVIVGGNTGAAPVPALGLLLGQVRDLVVEDVGDTSPAVSLQLLSQCSDGYYDLSSDHPAELRVPLTRGWWRGDECIDAPEVARRLRSGLPVTRPALAMPLRNSRGAWTSYDHVGVAGGNTLLLSPRALEARFIHVKYGEFTSRRADTTWALNARALRARVVRACLPFFHDRQRQPQTAVDAAREAVSDALGVGLYRSMLRGDATRENVLAVAQARLVELRTNLRAAEVILRSRIDSELLKNLDGWIVEARESLALRASLTTGLSVASLEV